MSGRSGSRLDLDLESNCCPDVQFENHLKRELYNFWILFNLRKLTHVLDQEHSPGEQVTQERFSFFCSQTIGQTYSIAFRLDLYSTFTLKATAEGKQNKTTTLAHKNRISEVIAKKICQFYFKIHKRSFTDSLMIAVKL